MTSGSNPPSHPNDERQSESFTSGNLASDVLAAQADADETHVAEFTTEFTGASQESQPEILLSHILKQKQEEEISEPVEKQNVEKQYVEKQTLGKQKVGEQCCAAREASGLAMEDIAAEIKIKPQHLLAIEEGRFGDLPSRTYAVGFVRAYATALNLDADALVAECRREVAHSMPQKQPHMMVPEEVLEQPLPSMSLVVMTAALAFLLSAVGYVFTREPIETVPVPPPVLSQPAEQNAVVTPASVPQPPSQQHVQQQAQPPIQQPVVQAVPHEEPATVDTAVVDTTHVSSGFLQKGLVAPSSPAPSVAGRALPPSRIKLKASDETMVQIFDASGRMIAERVINKGEAFYVPDKLGLTLATTNAGALQMQIDGREMQSLGDPDEAMHNVPLNADSLLKYLQ